MNPGASEMRAARRRPRQGPCAPSCWVIRARPCSGPAAADRGSGDVLASLDVFAHRACRARPREPVDASRATRSRARGAARCRQVHARACAPDAAMRDPRAIVRPRSRRRAQFPTVYARTRTRARGLLGQYAPMRPREDFSDQYARGTRAREVNHGEDRATAAANDGFRT